MPNVLPGVYIPDAEEYPYEVEECYFLNYQIECALAALEYIREKVYVESETPFESKYVYYHFYCDHLFFSWGQIANRFVLTGRDKKIERERKTRCRGNFYFEDSSFPLLSSKDARNMVEHIDERNHKAIPEFNGVGGFNLIDNNTEPSVAVSLKSKRDRNMYTLDLIADALYIHDIGKPKDIGLGKDMTIDLKALQDELLELQKNVRHFRDQHVSLKE